MFRFTRKPGFKPERPGQRRLWTRLLSTVLVFALVAATVFCWQPVQAYAAFDGAGRSALPLEKNIRRSENEGEPDKGLEAVEDLAETLGEDPYAEAKIQLSFDADALDEEMLALIEEALEMEIGWFKNLGLRFSAGVEESLVGGKTTLFFNDKDIITADFIADLAEEVFYFALSELDERYVSVDISEYTAMVNDAVDSEAAQELMERLSDGELIATLAARYGAILGDKLQNHISMAGVKELTAGELSGEFMTMELKIDAQAYHDIAEEVLTTARTDEELKELLILLLRTQGMDEAEAAQSYDEFLTEIDEAIKNLENIDVENDESEIVLNIYLDTEEGRFGGADLCAREDEENELFFLGLVFLTGEKTYALDMELRTADKGASYSEETDIRLSGGGELSDKGELDGSFDLYVKALSGWDGELEGFDGLAAKVELKAVSDDEGFRFTLTATPTEELLDTVLEEEELQAPVEKLIRSLSLAYSGTFRAEEPFELRLALLTDGKELLAASLEGAAIEKFDISVPTDAVDVETWAQELDTDALASAIVEALIEAGMPVQVIMNLAYA